MISFSNSKTPDRARRILLISAWIVFVIGLTLIPYIYGYRLNTAEQKFMGLIGPYGNDEAFYLGWGAKQAENGHFLFEDKYNGKTDRRMVFNPLWLIMGHAARICGFSVITCFHIERILFSAFLLVMVYLLSGEFFTRFRWRFACLMLVSVSSGFGILFAMGKLPGPTPDLWVIESNFFLSMLWEVNIPAGTAFFLLSLYLLIKAYALKSLRFALYCGVSTLILGGIYPYAVVSVYFMTIAITGLRMGQSFSNDKREVMTYLKMLAIIILISIPIMLYDGYLVITNPYLVASIILYRSPNLWLYFLGYGIFSLLAIPGIIYSIIKKDEKFFTVVLWLIVTFIQIYLPLPFQLQLIIGAHAAMTIMAVRTFSLLWEKIEVRLLDAKQQTLNLALALFSVVTLSSVTSIYQYVKVHHEIGRRQFPEFFHVEVLDAARWLAQNTKSSEVVLAAPQIAPYIPVLANNRMYTGDYEAPTPDFQDRKQKIIRLLNNTDKTNATVVDFLGAENIDYIFYDKYLKELGNPNSQMMLSRVSRLERVFTNSQVTIMKFIRAEGKR